MKKLICNICSIALGVIAAIMAFMPLFDTFTIAGEKTVAYEKAFGLFGENELHYLFSEYNPLLKTISMVLACIAMALVVAITLIAIIDMVKGKKAKNTGFKKLVGLLLIIITIAFVVTTVLFLNAHTITVLKVTTKISISNWFTFLVVPVGFFLSGVFALVADNK